MRRPQRSPPSSSFSSSSTTVIRRNRQLKWMVSRTIARKKILVQSNEASESILSSVLAIYCEANAMVEEYVSVENLGGIRDLQVLQVREEMSRERSRYLEAMVSISSSSLTIFGILRNLRWGLSAIYCEMNAMVEEYQGLYPRLCLKSSPQVYESLEHRLVVAEARKTHIPWTCQISLAHEIEARLKAKCDKLADAFEMHDIGLAGERGNVEGEITLFGSHGERNGGRVSIGCFSGKFWRNSRRSRSVPTAWLEELSSGHAIISNITCPKLEARLKAKCDKLADAFEMDDIGRVVEQIYGLQDFMSGKTALRNIMSILLPGVAILVVLCNLRSVDVMGCYLFLIQGFQNTDKVPGSYVVGVLESLSSKEKRTDKIITQNVEVHDLSAICAAPLAVLECYFLQAQGSLGLSVMGGPNSNLEELLEFEEENKLLLKEIEHKGRLQVRLQWMVRKGIV
ncbi:hypothetical protein HHK36_032354 [Tetracentron sinense]|uniref:Uncharacterized protein n=1 Tax=Tetracentron sinense TaxID=13715 RepID=A0A834YAW9_TETSI|nr:hypothetical protein HHK36_032354 [Tetracentron sinense]